MLTVADTLARASDTSTSKPPAATFSIAPVPATPVNPTVLLIDNVPMLPVADTLPRL